MASRRSIAVALLLLVVAGCRLRAEVDNDGEYAFFPNASPAETDARPLSDLLIIEQDAPGDYALYTLFRGELSAAGLGFEDLRVVAARHGGFQMHFETPRGRLAERAQELRLDEEEAERERVRIRANDVAVDLVEVDDELLAELGVTRWLRTLDSADYDVRVFVGVRDTRSTLRSIELDGRVHELGGQLAPALEAAPGVRSEPEDEDTLQFEFSPLDGPLEGPDYVQLDLLQFIERIDDGDLDGGVDEDAGVEPLPDGGLAEPPERDIREAMVRTTLTPDGSYVASFELLQDAFGQGCWSLERPLSVRVTQIARDYVERPGRDLAIIQRRAERGELPDTSWKAAIEEPEAASYCDSYRPAPD
jgi:hypothetical protein